MGGAGGVDAGVDAGVPGPITFVPVVAAALSTPVVSNVAPLTGFSTPMPVSVSSTVGAQYQVCSDQSCAQLIIDWTNASGMAPPSSFARLRLMSSATALTERTATLAVGPTTGLWQVTTGPAVNTQRFVESGTWTRPGFATTATARVRIQCWGGGGGGGAGGSTRNPTGGGGGGYSVATVFASTLPSVVAVQVGDGGVGAACCGDALPGGESRFGAVVVAGGGVGGRFTGGNGPPGGVGATEDGGVGGGVFTGSAGSTILAGGGGGGWDAPSLLGGVSLDGGGSGGAASDGTTNGQDGLPPGGGGGAAHSNSLRGGHGARGECVVVTMDP